MTEKKSKSVLELLEQHVKNFPQHGLAKEERAQCPICKEQMKWYRELVARTQELSLLVAEKEASLRKRLEDLEAKAKTAYQIHDLVRNNLHHTVDLKDYKWVSLDDVKELLGGSQEPRKEKNKK